jgi:integrase
MGDTWGTWAHQTCRNRSNMRSSTAIKKPALGQHLEWHGRKIRVVVRVPPSLKDQLGTKLRRVMETDNPKLAEVLKPTIVQELKAQIYRAKHGGRDDALIRSAMEFRAGYEKAKRLPDPEIDPDDPSRLVDDPEHVKLELAASNIADEIRASEGDARARMFEGIATGNRHPIMLFVDEWLVALQIAPKTKPSYRQSVKTLDEWAKAQDDVPQTLEAITPRLAQRFIEERFEKAGVHPTTANKLLSGLTSYWDWLIKTHRLDADTYRNPFSGRRVAKLKEHRSEHKTEPRPFTDKEVATLLTGIKKQPMADMMRLSLASGMRLDEIAVLRVGRIQDDKIEVRIGKSASSSREFPLPSALAKMLAKRCDKKGSDAYVFSELKDQKSEARGRGAPITQAFLRARKVLGVDDTPPGAKQSRVTFHSCRRWFIRKAVEALEQGATGYTPWTIADVVGHNAAEDGPLKMTMGLYPGKASLTAMRACVDAVKLP